MKGNYFNLKKGFMIFHILSGALALCAILFFMQNEKYSWVYKLCLLFYTVSGAAILTVFFKTLPLFQRLYFEVIFLIPLGIMVFWFFTKSFEYLFFGK
jgi:hypothetical protein